MAQAKQKVKSELDDIIMQFFDTLEQLSELQILLANHMENGFFMMSRSRYKMGVKAVDIGCFNIDKLSAIYRVDCDNNQIELFKMQPETMTTKTSNAEEMARVRRRATNQYNSHDPEPDVTNEISQEIEQITIEDYQEKDIKKSLHTSVLTKHDPINFFGILVPQALRDCQSNFVKAIQMAVDIASKKITLVDLQQRYKELQEQLKLLT